MELTTFERRPELDRYECVLTPAYMNGMPNKVCLLCPVEPAIEVMVYHLNLEPCVIEWMYEITAREYPNENFELFHDAPVSGPDQIATMFQLRGFIVVEPHEVARHFLTTHNDRLTGRWW